MCLQPHQPIDNVNSGLLQLLCPRDIGLFIEAGFEQHGAQPSATGPPKQADQQTRGMGRATNAAAMPPAAPVSGASVAITRRAQFLQLHTSLRPNRARLDASLLSAEQTQREAQHILQRVEAAGIDPRMRPGTLLA